MTSTISSTNKNLAKLYKWAFGRNRALMIVFAVLMMVGIVIDIQALITISNSGTSTETINDAPTATVGYVSMFIAQLGAVFFSIASAIHTFGFLHNKRSTDMFGAVPATRSTLYFSHLLGGITAVTIPFTVGSFIVMALTCRSTQCFRIELGFILMGIITIVAVYSFTALIAYCCGTSLDSVIIAFGANGIYMGVVAIFIALAYSMIPGLAGSNQFFNTPFMTLFAPAGFSAFFDIYCTLGQMTAMWATVIWSILFTAGMILLGNYAAKTRKAETAQNEFNIKWLPIVIKAGISVRAGGLSGMAAVSGQESSFSNVFIFAFWYIITGFAAFIILHLVFSRGTKVKLLPSLLAYAGTTAAALGLLFAMTTGMGIDTYIPAESNISSVVFQYDHMEYKDPENIKTIIEIHKLMTEGTLKNTPRPYYMGIGRNDYYSYYESEDCVSKYPLSFSSNFSFKYNKKFGFTTERCYYLHCGKLSLSPYDYEKIEALLRKLYNSDEYKKLSNPELWEENFVERISQFPVVADMDITGYSGKTERYYPTGNINLKTDEKFLKGLVDALKKDILADKEYYKSRIMRDSVYAGDRCYCLSIGYGESLGNTIIRETVRIQVSETYTNTLNYLRNNGYASELDNPSFSVDDSDYTDDDSDYPDDI